MEEWRTAQSDDLELLAKFRVDVDLPEAIHMLAAPGHTFGLHALSAETTWGTLVIAGDSVMTTEFFDEEEGYHNSVDFTLAAETIRNIKNIASLVIPGHGNIIINMH
ncbi:MAG: hypothetical protein P1S60_19960, partial [Anaerolineae bacterium]|nr:hypothetical protein [Anaerolineae bacterium]